MYVLSVRKIDGKEKKMFITVNEAKENIMQKKSKIVDIYIK